MRVGYVPYNTDVYQSFSCLLVLKHIHICLVRLMLGRIYKFSKEGVSRQEFFAGGGGGGQGSSKRQFSY